MLHEAELAACAWLIVGTVERVGTRSRRQVIEVLGGLGLEESDAETVIAYALAEKLLVADGDTLRAVQP
jgi:hypothetical protein